MMLAVRIVLTALIAIQVASLGYCYARKVDGVGGRVLALLMLTYGLSVLCAWV